MNCEKNQWQTAIQNMEKRLQYLRLNIHGYQILYRGELIGERYWEPFGRDSLHRMYSITKSFTALAIGLLAAEGRIRLEDRICSYFPGKLPEGGVHPWCGEMTIRDLLTMRTCYESTTFKRYDGDWVESFFRVQPDHVPGTVFNYDTSASHVLAALVEKLTGGDMLDYLREKVLRKVGFSEEAYLLKDPYGVSQGGSGLVCKLGDLAGIAMLCCHGGMLDGEQLIPADFLREATACQVPTDLQPTFDEQLGYGYMMWKTRYDGFVFYGMGGQLALCFPKQDLVFLTMADTIGNPAGLQMLYDCFYDTVYPAVTETDEYDWTPGLPEGDTRHGVESWRFYGPQDSEGGACDSRGWDTVTFDWGRQILTLVSENQTYEWHYGNGVWEHQKFPDTEYACECRGEWSMGHFVFHSFLTDEEEGHVAMDFAWKGDRMSVRLVSTSEPPFAKLKGFWAARRI